MKSILFSIKKYFARESLARTRRRVRTALAEDRRRYIQSIWVEQGKPQEI